MTPLVKNGVAVNQARLPPPAFFFFRFRFLGGAMMLPRHFSEPQRHT